MNARGFTILELLVSMALVLTVTSALAGTAMAMRDAHERMLASADMDAGPRVALTRIEMDVRGAGAGPSIAAASVRFARVVGAVRVQRALDDRTSVQRGEALEVASVPRLAAQGAAREALAAGATVIALDTSTRCKGGPPTCGFEPTMAAAVMGDTGACIVTVEATGDGAVSVQPPMCRSFAAGAVVAEVDVVIYGLRADAGGAGRLVRVTRTVEQPILDHVVEFVVTRDAADPTGGRSVGLSLRVEAPSAVWRGPGGALFRRAGTASRARTWLPDSVARAAIALRGADAP